MNHFLACQTSIPFIKNDDELLYVITPAENRLAAFAWEPKTEAASALTRAMNVTTVVQSCF